MRIRIALACSGLDHVRRGVEAWSQQAFLALRERGLDVTLFKGSGDNGGGAVRVLPCLRRGSPLSQRLSRTLPAWSWRAGFGSPYQAEQTTFAASLLTHLRNRFAILHTKDPHVAWVVRQASRLGLTRAKVILNHGTEEPLEFLRRFDYIQHLAPIHLERARTQGLRVKRQFVVPNFVDTGTFHPGSGARQRAQLGIPQEAFVILCVAAIKRTHKRVDWLLQEVAGLPAEGPAGRPIYLLLVGATTRETEGLVAMGRALLGNRVIVLADLPHGDMPGIYRAADVFVLCSHKEMLANVFLEALASGVPCVASRSPVAEWVIGEGGRHVDMGAPGALRQTIRLYFDPGFRGRISEEARRRAVACFSKDVVIGQQIEMYREVLHD